MKINFLQSNINFGKTLIANCMLPRKSAKPLPCKIYEIKTTDDKDYFLKLSKKDMWRDGDYVHEMDDEFNSEVTGQRTFVMENQKDKCLGYVIVETDFDTPDKSDIVYLETCPKYKSSNPKRTIKYIGETLLAFVVKIAQKDNMKSVCIPVWTTTAENFYKENCGFQEIDE